MTQIKSSFQQVFTTCFFPSSAAHAAAGLDGVGLKKSTRGVVTGGSSIKLNKEGGGGGFLERLY